MSYFWYFFGDAFLSKSILKDRCLTCFGTVNLLFDIVFIFESILLFWNSYFKLPTRSLLLCLFHPFSLSFLGQPTSSSCASWQTNIILVYSVQSEKKTRRKNGKHMEVVLVPCSSNFFLQSWKQDFAKKVYEDYRVSCSADGASNGSLTTAASVRLRPAASVMRIDVSRRGRDWLNAYCFWMLLERSRRFGRRPKAVHSGLKMFASMVSSQ